MRLENYTIIEPPTSSKVGELVLKVLSRQDVESSRQGRVSLTIRPEARDIPSTEKEHELSFRIFHTFHPDVSEDIYMIVQGKGVEKQDHSGPHALLDSIVDVRIARDSDQPSTLTLVVPD